MINLSDIAIYYINNTFQPELRKTIYNSFSVLESFGKLYYEDKFIGLVQREDDITSEAKQDTFFNLVFKEVKDIVDEHSLIINEDSNITLNELNEIANFLFIVQRLEDYDLISYRLYAEDLPRNIIVDIIATFTLLEKPRLMEIIDNRDDHFVMALKAFVEDKQKDNKEPMNTKHIRHIRYFIEFIENTKCLGGDFYNDKFTQVTLNEFVNVTNIDIPSHIDSIILLNDAQAALDCLSVLMVCKDSYELPLLKFKQCNSFFTNKLENVTKLEAIMLSILNDFTIFKTIKNQEEAINAN